MVNVSIIVPVYNVEKFLPRCIDSILTQSFNQYELILVNDGSTDSSGDICDYYSKVDSRIKVIHKENAGTSSARNVGLKVATGDYIGFVDGDDYINKFMFEKLYNHAITNSSDIVMCDFLNVNEYEEDETQNVISINGIKDYTNIEAINEMYTSKSNNILFIVAWNKLYKRGLFNGIEYKLGALYDDETIAHKLLYNSEKVTYVGAKLYYYVQRHGSTMNSPYQIKRLDKVYILKEREIYFRNKKEVGLHQHALKDYMEKFFWNYFQAKSQLMNVEKDLKELKKTFNRSLFYLLKLKNISWKQKAMCILFSFSPLLFEFIKNKNSGRGYI